MGYVSFAQKVANRYEGTPVLPQVLGMTPGTTTVFGYDSNSSVGDDCGARLILKDGSVSSPMVFFADTSVPNLYREVTNVQFYPRPGSRNGLDLLGKISSRVAPALIATGSDDDHAVEFGRRPRIQETPVAQDYNVKFELTFPGDPLTTEGGGARAYQIEADGSLTSLMFGGLGLLPSDQGQLQLDSAILFTKSPDKWMAQELRKAVGEMLDFLSRPEAYAGMESRVESTLNLLFHEGVKTPRLRQAYQELGGLYFRAHKYEKAIALQSKW